MKTLEKKILIDCLMALSLIIAMIPSGILPFFTHIAAGASFYILAWMHFLLNRKTLKALKKSGKYKFQVFIDYILIIVWILVLLSDIPAMIYKVGGVQRFAIAPFIHASLGRVAVFVTLVHILGHWKQINSYRKRIKS